VEMDVFAQLIQPLLEERIFIVHNPLILFLS
jgi:hypothetical protein